MQSLQMRMVHYEEVSPHFLGRPAPPHLQVHNTNQKFIIYSSLFIKGGTTYICIFK